MGRVKEDKSVRGYASRKRQYKRIRNLMIIIVILALIVIGAIVAYSIYNRNYHGYKVTNTSEIKGETTKGFLGYGNSMLKYGKDGAIAYDKDGKTLWNCAYEMSDPVADICGEYVVIGDRRNKQVRVINGKGNAVSYTTDFNIIKAEVSEHGVTAILMEEGDNNYIKIYNLKGNVLADIKTNVKSKDDGYPLDISLSNDGTKLVISLLVILDGQEFTRIGFYNFGEVGQNATDNIVGGFNSDKGVIASRVEFVNNETVCVYKNNGFDIYNVKEKPKLVKSITTKSAIKSILYNSKYTGIVTEANSKSAKKLLLYNLSGKTVLEHDIDLEYKKILLRNDEIILYDERNCFIIRKNGKLKFKYTFKGDITDLYPINKFGRYYLVSDTKLSVIELKD